ncbi:hypothetical protein KEN37_004778 [Salmonella enterica]|nr:hypothetical protein [Salmonella enterica]
MEVLAPVAGLLRLILEVCQCGRWKNGSFTVNGGDLWKYEGVPGIRSRLLCWRRHGCSLSLSFGAHFKA